VDAQVFRARAVLKTGSGVLRGREAPATPEVAAGPVAASAVQAPATAEVAAGPVAASAVQAPATAVRVRAARTVVPAAVVRAPAVPLRLRPAGTPIPAALGTGVPGLLLTGARLQVAGRKRSGPRHTKKAVAGIRTADGTGQRPDVTAQLLRGGTVPEVVERPNPKTSPSLGPSRARSVAPPRQVATSGRAPPGLRGRNRPVVSGESSPARAGEFRGLRALRVRPQVAGRPPLAATSGRRRLGEAPAVLASHSAAAVVCPRLLVGVVMQRYEASSAVTRSRVARPSGSCLPHTGGKFTRSG
jgi:hypothetical protein